MRVLLRDPKIHCRVFAPDFQIVYDELLSSFDASRHQTIIYHNERITSKQRISTLTENIISIEVLPGQINIWYESGAHMELTK
jgi:hypothetical protein